MSPNNGDTLTREKVLEKVIAIASEQLMVDASGILEKNDFADDLGADSLDSVELIMSLEDEFGFEIDEADAEKLTTVGLVTDHIFSRLTKTEG